MIISLKDVDIDILYNCLFIYVVVKIKRRNYYINITATVSIITVCLSCSVYCATPNIDRAYCTAEATLNTDESEPERNSSQ